MKKSRKNHLISLLNMMLISLGLPILYLITGIMALFEAKRIQAKLHVEAFFSGPSGYMSIVGVVLLLLFVPEVIEGINKFKKNLQRYAEEQITTETHEESVVIEEDRINTNRMWVVFLMLVGYIIVIKRLGFLISSCVFLIVSMLYLGNKWLTMLLTVSIVAVFLVFCPYFGITLPKGIFGI
jgi:hypothetical protein